IGVDVRVIEFDVSHNRDIREVLEEFGGLVEEGAVVFVTFDHEVAPATNSEAGPIRPEVERDAADEERRIECTAREQPSRERRGRGLPVRAGNNDGTRTPK